MSLLTNLKRYQKQQLSSIPATGCDTDVNRGGGTTVSRKSLAKLIRSFPRPGRANMFGFGLLLLVLFFSWVVVRTYYDITDTPITLASSLSGADRIKLRYLEIDLKEQDPREPSFRGKLYLYFHKYGADGPRQVTVFRSSDRGYGRSRSKSHWRTLMMHFTHRGS
jgi:hypothetical protein